MTPYFVLYFVWYYIFIMQSYLFFGPPGSGKGTQKDLLSGFLEGRTGDFPVVIETGQILRDLKKEKDTLVKRLLADVMERGGLVPSAFPISGWVQTLVQEAGRCEHVIIDGAGRKLLEAIIIVELLQFFPDSHIHIVYLDVHDEEVVDRLLKRGREDDKEDIIKTRLDLYKDTETGTMASLNFLRKSDDVVFHTVDGVGPIPEVHQRVRDTLGI